MSTSDAIAIGATCLGAGITVLALIVAFASLWGVTVIGKKARKAAERVARTEVLKLLDEKSELGSRIRDELQKRVDAAADNLFSDLSFSGAFGGESPSGTIASEYPGGTKNAD